MRVCVTVTKMILMTIRVFFCSVPLSHSPADPFGLDALWPPCRPVLVLWPRVLMQDPPSPFQTPGSNRSQRVCVCNPFTIYRWPFDYVHMHASGSPSDGFDCLVLVLNCLLQCVDLLLQIWDLRETSLQRRSTSSSNNHTRESTIYANQSANHHNKYSYAGLESFLGCLHHSTPHRSSSRLCDGRHRRGLSFWIDMDRCEVLAVLCTESAIQVVQVAFRLIRVTVRARVRIRRNGLFVRVVRSCCCIYRRGSPPQPFSPGCG